MAWNGSGGAADAPRSGERRRTTGCGAKPRPVPSARAKGPLRGALAAFAVVLGTIIGGLAIHYLGGHSEPCKLQPEDKHPVANTAQSDLPQKVVRQKKELTPQEPELSEAWKQYYDGRDTNKWIVVKDPKTGREYLSRLMKPGLKNRKPPLYKSNALNVLNAILFKDPGTPLPAIKIDDRFMKSFQDALVEKIDISEEDSESDRLLKMSMIETIEHLKAELKKGSDIKQLLSDALAERQRIAALKHMMVQERVKMRNSGASEQEIAEFEEACNKKLAEKGASPLLTPAIMMQRIESQKNHPESRHGE